MAARVESHVTVIYELDDIARAAHAVAGRPPLRLWVGQPALWEAEVPGIYLAVSDPHGDLSRFRAAALGASEAAFQPHITILHRDSVASIEQVDQAWSSLRAERFDAELTVGELVVYELVDDVWQSAARLHFA